MALEKVRREKAIPIPEHFEIKQEEPLFRGTIAVEFVVTKKPDGTKDYKIIEVNGQNSLITETRYIKGNPKSDNIFLKVREHSGDRVTIYDPLDKHANPNLIELEILTVDKEATNVLLASYSQLKEHIPRSWTFGRIRKEKNLPEYLVIKPLFGNQGKGISIIPSKELYDAVQYADTLVEQYDSMKKDNIVPTQEFALEIEKALQELKPYQDMYIEEFIPSVPVDNSPEELKDCKATIRYGIDFTFTKSGKIIPEFSRAYASLIKKPKDPNGPSVDTEVLSNDTQIEYVPLSEDEEAKTKELTEAVIKILAKNHFPKDVVL